MKNDFLCFLSFFVFFISFGQPLVSIDDRPEKLDALIEKFVEYEQFNGSVLVADNGRIIYKKGFGMANFEWNNPNETDTKFRLASVTKQFTALLILQLAAEKKLDLHAPITKYITDYPTETGDKVTTHHLLTHSSGIPNFTDYPNYRKIMGKRMQPEDLVSLFKDSNLNFKPGDKFEYSNSAYVLLGVIIEKITGKSYQDVLQERIFTPLKMTSSGYDNHEELITNRAAGYYRKGNKLVNANFIDMSVPFSAGAIYSTIEDLFLWDQALYTEQLLPKEYIKLMFGNHNPTYNGYYGYGWDIQENTIGNTDEKKLTYSHGGFINGFNTRITRFPTQRATIILLNNTSGAPLVPMTRSIAGIVFGTTYGTARMPVAKALFNKINSEGIDAGKEFFKEIKGSKDYYMSEEELNLAGYDFMLENRYKEAECIFKLVVETFPSSSNAYDSYAEALMMLGKKKLSKENYLYSLKLNPNNQNAVEMMKRLEE